MKNRVAAATARSPDTRAWPGHPPPSRAEAAQRIWPPRKGHRDPQGLLHSSRFMHQQQLQLPRERSADCRTARREKQEGKGGFRRVSSAPGAGSLLLPSPRLSAGSLRAARVSNKMLQLGDILAPSPSLEPGQS